jgi:hypothetical protein
LLDAQDTPAEPVVTLAEEPEVVLPWRGAAASAAEPVVDSVAAMQVEAAATVVADTAKIGGLRSLPQMPPEITHKARLLRQAGFVFAPSKQSGRTGRKAN